MFLPLLLACAARTWTHEVKPKGKPDIVAIDPLYLVQASVEDAGVGQVSVWVRVDQQARDHVTQSFRHAEVGRYSVDSSRDASAQWVAAAGIGGILSLLPAAALGGALGDEYIYPAMGTSCLVVGVSCLLVAGAQYAAPLYPARRKDRRVESLTSTQARLTTPWAGTVLITSSPGGVIEQGTTTEDGSVFILLAVPELDHIQVRLDGTNWSSSVVFKNLDLRGTKAWYQVRSTQVRDLAASGERADLDAAYEIIRLSGLGESKLWTPYCEGFSQGWGGKTTRKQSIAFNAASDAPACKAIWSQLDTAWAERLAKRAELGDSEWNEELPDNLASFKDRTPALRALGECASLNPHEDPFTAALQATEALIDPAPHTASCFRSVLTKADSELARIEAEMDRQIAQIEAEYQAEIAADKRRCDTAKRSVAKEMRRLTSTAYADSAEHGLRKTINAAHREEDRRFGAPTYEDDEWFRCVYQATEAAQEWIWWNGSVNQGGFAHEWVELGRFKRAQESILDSFAQPGQDCRAFVRENLGSTTLAPVDRYLKAVDRLDEACQD